MTATDTSATACAATGSFVYAKPTDEGSDLSNMSVWTAEASELASAAGTLLQNIQKIHKTLQADQVPVIVGICQ